VNGRGRPARYVRVVAAGPALVALLALAASVCERGPQQLGRGPRADEDPAAVLARGEQTYLSSHGVPSWRESTYWNIWKAWGEKSRPPEFEARFRERYGLHPAPYPNGPFPMGLGYTKEGLKGERAFAMNCQLCHSGSILGKSYVGLPNSTLDMQQLEEDLNATEGVKTAYDFSMGETRGLNAAGAAAVFLTALRNPDLSVGVVRFLTHTYPDLGWKQMVDVDTPPDWHWKLKRWLYWDGAVDARSHTSATFMLLSRFRSLSGKDLLAEYDDWRDVRTFIQARVEAPAYPLPIDRARAARGAAVYGDDTARCADCHGAYDDSFPPRLLEYDTPIVPLSQLGTDPTRYETLTDAFIDKYNSIHWFSSNYKARKKAERPRGYVAPPLAGVWATAPYLHNGSVPPVLDLLSPKAARPHRYYRQLSTGLEAYDADKLGWKVVDCPPASCSAQDLPYPRMIYDTSRRGLDNGGHLWGVDLSPAQKKDLLEFLKTL
jgi:hypothetical protein